MNSGSKIPVPAAVGRPSNPVRPGSVLHGLLESTDAGSTRCASRFNGNIQEDTTTTHSAPTSARNRFSNETGIPSPRHVSNRPTRQAGSFEKSLRQYNKCQSRTMPSTRVTSPSPFSIRPPTTAAAEARSTFSRAKLNSYKDNFEKKLGLAQKSISNACKTLMIANKPPISQKLKEVAADAVVPHTSLIPKPNKNSITSPDPTRRVRLAYGINKIPEIQSPRWIRSKSLNIQPEEDVHSNKIPQLLEGEERFIRMLHTQEMVKIERTQTKRIRESTVDKGTDPLYVEFKVLKNKDRDKACQTISIDNIVKTIQEESPPPGFLQDNRTSESTRSKQSCKHYKKLLKENEIVNLSLSSHVDRLKKQLDILSMKNESLEIQLFEHKEELFKVESLHRNNKVHESGESQETQVQFVQTDWIPTCEYSIPPELLEKLKFPLESFITTQFPFINDTGDAKDNQKPHQKLQVTQIALAAREGLLSELKGKLKKGYKLLQRRFDSLQIGENPENKIFPPEADFVLNSYRRFVRYITNYIEQSLLDIKKFDQKNVFETENCDSNYFHQKTVEINGEPRFGIFIPIPSLSPSKTADAESESCECQNQTYEETDQNTFLSESHDSENNRENINQNSENLSDLECTSGESPLKEDELSITDMLGPKTGCANLFQNNKNSIQDSENESDLVCKRESTTSENSKKEDKLRINAHRICANIFQDIENINENAGYLRNHERESTISESFIKEDDKLALRTGCCANIFQNTSDDNKLDKDSKSKLKENSLDTLHPIIEGLAAAKVWIERPINTNFILDPVSFSKFLSPSNEDQETKSYFSMENFKSPTNLNKKSSNGINEIIKADSNVTIWKSAKYDNTSFDISEMTLNDPTLLHSSQSTNDINGNPPIKDK